MLEAFTLNFKRGRELPYRLVATSLRRWEPENLETDTVEMLADSVARRGTFPDFASRNGDSVRLLALAFVRVARWQLAYPFGISPKVAAIFEGRGSDSVAAKFKRQRDSASLSSPDYKWIAEMFPRSGDERGGGVLTRWFKIREISGASVVECHPSDAPAVMVNIEGEPVSETELDGIESFLSEALSAGSPHFLFGNGTAIAGRLPSVRADWFLRKEETYRASEVYFARRSTFLAFVGAPETGKTVFAVQWLQYLAAAGRLRQELVFSWIFGGPGMAGNDAISVAGFLGEFARLLGITFATATPSRELPRPLLDELANKSVFLLLDGIDACFGNPEATETLAVLIEAVTRNRESFVVTTSRQAPEHALRFSSEGMARVSVGPVPLHLEHRPGYNFTTGAFICRGQRESEDLDRWREAFREAELWRMVKKTFALPSERDAETIVAEKSGHVAPIAQHYSPQPIPARDMRASRMVNLLVYHVRARAAEILLHILSACDFAIGEDMLLSVASKLPVADYGIKRKPSSKDWREALAWVVSSSMARRTKRDGAYLMHPACRMLIRDSLKKERLDSWIAINMALGDALLKSGAKLPSSHDEVVPLVQAVMHFCAAGKKKLAYKKICYPRLSRGLKGYLLSYLGDYESSLGLNHALAGEGSSETSDLSDVDKALIQHVNALCLRYLDRLVEASRAESDAWERALKTRSPMAILPVGFNLLRLHHIHGDLRPAKAVIEKLNEHYKNALRAGSLLSFVGLLSKEDRMDGAAAMTSMHALMSLFCGEDGRNVDKILEGGMGHCAASGRKHLLPSYGTVWHAFALLEMGKWKACADAMKDGELASEMKRFRQTGSIELLSARTLLCKARGSPEDVRQSALSDAATFASDALTKAQAGNYRWWKAISHLTLGQIIFDRGETLKAREHLDAAIGISREVSFKLLLVDALVERAEQAKETRNIAAMREDAAVANEEARRIGYCLRAGALRRLL